MTVFALSDKVHEGAEPLGALEAFLASLRPEEVLIISSQLSNMLNLHNIAEDVANVQAERAHRAGELERQVPSTDDIIKTLLMKGVPKERLYEALKALDIDLVMTAHPTQALPRSVLKANKKIRRLLNGMHESRKSPHQIVELKHSLRAQIEALYRSDELSRTKPTPQDEMRHGISYFQETVFHSVPQFLRRLDTSLAKMGIDPLPPDCCIFNFGSWMGGDRDGNPNVTPECTRDVIIIARLAATDLLFNAVEELMFDLSVWRCTDEVRAYLRDGLRNRFANPEELEAERRRRNYSNFWTPCSEKTEPYRVILQDVRDCLYDTREALHHCLTHPKTNILATLEASATCYVDSKELLEPLLLMHRSLVERGDKFVANDRLLDLIRQVRVFGLTLVRLDIRQESTRHSSAMSAITEYLGLGAYAEWGEEERVKFLVEEIENSRPLIPPNFRAEAPEDQDALDTFKVLSQLPSDSLGAYIISMAKAPSDVLVIMLLQKEFGVKRPLRVVPLFETLDDIDAAPQTMTALFSNAWYLERIRGQQECMLGYSDSGKDAGRLAAAYALYVGQEKLTGVARDFGVKMRFFHGRGGTVGRGGGPLHVAIRSQPPGTIEGSLRVTIQGEIIEHDFGDAELTFKTLDIYASSTLHHLLHPPAAPKPEWRAVMETLSALSCDAFRGAVYRNPDFVKYFNTATPVTELGRLNIGSRPAKRKKSPGLGSLRAIPWIFAWTQTRFHLPVWLGIGEAIEAAKAQGHEDTLAIMHQQWPFFSATVDMIEMVLAKADPKIEEMYEKSLCGEELYPVGEDLRRRFVHTKQMLLSIVAHDSILGSNVMSSNLKYRLGMRARYITPLNIIQSIYLRKVRDDSDAPEDYEVADPETRGVLSLGGEANLYKAAVADTVMLTMKGIAAGMQNTG